MHKYNSQKHYWIRLSLDPLDNSSGIKCIWYGFQHHGFWVVVLDFIVLHTLHMCIWLKCILYLDLIILFNCCHKRDQIENDYIKQH